MPSLTPRLAASTALLLLSGLLGSCGGGGSTRPDSAPGSDLSGFEVRTIQVDGNDVEAWIADTPSKHAQGFMNASADQLAPLPDGTPRGMLFIFSSERVLSFWMANTYVPLDLAYVRSDGTIADLYQLVPHDRDGVPSSEPVLWALELPEGTVLELDVNLDDVVTDGTP